MCPHWLGPYRFLKTIFLLSRWGNWGREKRRRGLPRVTRSDSSQCPLTGTSMCHPVHCGPHPLWSPGARQASLLTFMLVDTGQKVKWGVTKLGSRHSISGQPAVKQTPFKAHSLAPPQVCSWAEWHPQSSRPVIRGSWQTLLFHFCSHALSIWILGFMQTQLFSSCTRTRSPSQLGLLLAWRCLRSPLSSILHSDCYTLAWLSSSPSPVPPCSYQITAPPSSRKWALSGRGFCFIPFLPAGLSLPPAGLPCSWRGVPHSPPGLPVCASSGTLLLSCLLVLTISLSPGFFCHTGRLWSDSHPTTALLPLHPPPASLPPSLLVFPVALVTFIVYSQPPTHSQLPYGNSLP